MNKLLIITLALAFVFIEANTLSKKRAITDISVAMRGIHNLYVDIEKGKTNFEMDEELPRGYARLDRYHNILLTELIKEYNLTQIDFQDTSCNKELYEAEKNIQTMFAQSKNQFGDNINLKSPKMTSEFCSIDQYKRESKEIRAYLDKLSYEKEEAQKFIEEWHDKEYPWWKFWK